MGDHYSTEGNLNVAQDHGTAVQNNIYGVPPEMLVELAGKLAVTESALKSFFKIIEEQQVPIEDLDSTLREIAARYKALLERMATVDSEDPQVVALKTQARQAITGNLYDQAEELLTQAEDCDLHAIEELEHAAKQRRLSAAATRADRAEVQRLRLCYAEASGQYQQAAALLPAEEKKQRAFYLSEAGYDFHRVARYIEALPLYEQSLSLYREIGYKKDEGVTLNNISAIYLAQGEYDTALKSLQQSLTIRWEIGDRAGEAVTCWNIGCFYRDQGDLLEAEQPMNRAVQLAEEIGHQKREEWRKKLEALRIRIQDQQTR